MCFLMKNVVIESYYVKQIVFPWIFSIVGELFEQHNVQCMLNSIVNLYTTFLIQNIVETTTNLKICLVILK